MCIINCMCWYVDKVRTIVYPCKKGQSIFAHLACHMVAAYAITNYMCWLYMDIAVVRSISYVYVIFWAWLYYWLCSCEPDHLGSIVWKRIGRFGEVGAYQPNLRCNGHSLGEYHSLPTHPLKNFHKSICTSNIILTHLIFLM